MGTTTALLEFSRRACLIVEGDVRSELRLPAGGLVIVHGDVAAPIRLAEHSELIVAGDVLDAASLSTDGIFDLFVGGDLNGELRSQGSCVAWIEGHLRGPVWTGTPSTRLRVKEGCSARIQPSSVAALLYLEVGGSMPSGALGAIGAFGYTEFQASIGSSDRPSGLYPDKEASAALRQRHGAHRWVIRHLDGQV